MDEKPRKSKKIKATFFEEYKIHEDLLQTYRNFFISIQSFMIAVGAIMLSVEIPFYLWIFVPAIAMLIIIGLWYPAVRVKILLVDFYKYSLHDKVDKITKIDGFVKSRKMENYHKRNPKHELTPADYYVHDKALRDGINSGKGIKTWRGTRTRVDLFLPSAFLLIWIILIISKLCYF